MVVKMRDRRYDLIRVIAMGLVILIHAMDSVQLAPSLTNQIWKEAATTLIMLCNPLFFMMSGHFNLHFKGTKKEDYNQYYWKKVINIIIPLIIYQLIYYIVTVSLTGGFKTVKSFVHLFILNIFQNYVTTYFWFMYLLIAFLIAAPFLSKMLDQLSNTEQKIFMIVLIGIQVAGWLFKVVGINWGLNSYPFSGWLIYFLLGRLLETNNKSITQFERLLIIALVVVVNTLLLIIFPQSKAWGLFDLSPLYIILSVVMYNGLLNSRACRNLAGTKLTAILSRYSFGIYLSHGAVLLIIVPYLQQNHSIIGILLIFVSTYVIAAVVAISMDNLVIKPIRRLFYKMFILTN
ncbi:acyltransferase [Latilactobacillus fuchuensis]|uniref:acyltransferase n=1 Tax=Latilactobacillus fuchuensis TaxID=164393 RepID=UPI0020C7774E|nr:acyltransferase [Latilactobacillus fuchuensis]MCP8856941.1 acyltransferase [Latilactobacillus fuchuensis]